MKSLQRMVRCSGGAAAIEFAVIIWVLVFVCVGVIEFGRGLHVRNEMSYAADLAARKILTFPEFSAEVLSSTSEQELREDVRAAFTGPNPETLLVDFASETDSNGVQFRTMLIRYSFSLLIPGLRDAFELAVSRRVPIG